MLPLTKARSFTWFRMTGCGDGALSVPLDTHVQSLVFWREALPRRHFNTCLITLPPKSVRRSLRPLCR